MKVFPADTNPCIICYIANTFHILHVHTSIFNLKVLLSIIISTLGALGNLTFILLIVIYIFAILGMQVKLFLQNNNLSTQKPLLMALASCKGRTTCQRTTTLAQ